jgi:hypothetical protein
MSYAWVKRLFEAKTLRQQQWLLRAHDCQINRFAKWIKKGKI